MNEDSILDLSAHSRAKELTDFQLVGVLSEKIKYPPYLIEEIENELKQRNLSALEIDNLRKRYLVPILITDGFRFGKKKLFWLWFVVLFGVAQTNWIPFLVGISIIIVSLVALKKRFTKGLIEVRKVWKRFALLYLLLFLGSVVLRLWVF